MGEDLNQLQRQKHATPEGLLKGVYLKDFIYEEFSNLSLDLTGCGAGAWRKFLSVVALEMTDELRQQWISDPLKARQKSQYIVKLLPQLVSDYRNRDSAYKRDLEARLKAATLNPEEEDGPSIAIKNHQSRSTHSLVENEAANNESSNRKRQRVGSVSSQHARMISREPSAGNNVVKISEYVELLMKASSLNGVERRLNFT